MPVVYMGTGIVTSLLALVGCLYRWNDISFFVKKHILRRPLYNYRDIFHDYLERFHVIEDRQNLYAEILAVTCRLVSAAGASLVIKEPSGAFKMCAAHGLAPFSFEMTQVRGFLSWMEKKRIVITREQLVSEKSYHEIKSEGLRYCVQFNAEACAPLFLGKSLYGVLNVGSRKINGYDKETRELLSFLAEYFTSVIRRVDLYQELMRRKLELKQAADLRNQILSNLSHELRTPLNSIIGLSEILAEGQDGALTPEQAGHVSLIHDSGKRLLDSITNIVDLSKIEANHLELNISRINVRRLISDVAQNISFNKHTSFNLEIDEDSAQIFGDEERLRLVFRHLLDNAAKFTKRGKVSVDASKCGEMLKVRVTDTGIGIPDEKQDTILAGFCQAESGTAREYEGLGLGLVISRKIIELHGGRLWFVSKLGYGSNFYVTLPLKPTGMKHPEISFN
jgi:signal transduction histidine kinase